MKIGSTWETDEILWIDKKLKWCKVFHGVVSIDPRPLSWWTRLRHYISLSVK